MKGVTILWSVCFENNGYPDIQLEDLKMLVKSARRFPKAEMMETKEDDEEDSETFLSLVLKEAS